MNNAKDPTKLPSSLARLADRLKSDPSYMAWVIRTYNSQESLSDQRLADRLQTNVAMITRLALCKRPQADSPVFCDQIRQLAEYTFIDIGMLAHLIRQVDAMIGFSSVPLESTASETETQPLPARGGLLAAARDRTEPESEKEDEAPRDSTE